MNHAVPLPDLRIPSPSVRVTKNLFAHRFHPGLHLVAIFIKAGLHPACHAGDPGIGSPAMQFGMTATEYTDQIGHKYLCGTRNNNNL